MNYSSLEEVYGKPFGQRAPVTQQAGPSSLDKPLEKSNLSLEERGQQSIKKHEGLLQSVLKTLPLDTTPETQNYRIEIPKRIATRETFTSSQPANMVVDFDQSEKISRILRLIEQNKTGYERPATQDMVLYIATGIFFLFTFDTFVMLGKSMRGK
jgi:hypothetical protein